MRGSFLFRCSFAFLLLLASLAGAPASAERAEAEAPLPAASERVMLPEPIPDPFEPMNRLIWEVNHGVMKTVGRPSSRAYRALFAPPVRVGISNFGRNVRYPSRVINHLLQARWTGARDETYRFLCNSVAGAGGVFDVATRWGIPRSEADFGQTFGVWGWDPKLYLMLPIGGPSNDRDAFALIPETFANPLVYFAPYSYANLAVAYNEYAHTVDDSLRMVETEMDPYALLHYAATYARDVREPDWRLHGEQDPATLETLQSLFFTVKDREFPNRGRTRSALIPSTGKKLKFTFWLQRDPAPVVYIVPGLGSHRLSSTALALAELVYREGFSVVNVSSPFHAEFMQHASTSAMPAYPPVDTRDLHQALTAVHARLEDLHPGRFRERALMGYSMGGFYSLLIAATKPAGAESLTFDRHVAINTPVRLLHGMSRLDDLYQAPLEWPSAERTERLENTFLKIAAMRKTDFSTNSVIPLSAVESKFLVGLAFRVTLRDVIFTSQQRNDMGMLNNRLSRWRREPVLYEILQYSYADYLNYFLTPYYNGRGIDFTSPAMLNELGDLRTFSREMEGHSEIRIIQNENDFLLADEDLDWLRATFDPGRLTIFPRGGHLGNLAHPAVQKAILQALDGLQR
jgi:ABC-type transporter lipoprotein component MlaA/pimeloyl-ACP methyl ester carboxylesterase